MLANEMGCPKEALPYLSRGMIRIIREMIYVVLGYARLYASQRDLVSGTALLEWGIHTLQGLKASNAPDYPDKICAVFFTHLAGFQMDSGDRSGAGDSLRHAIDLSRRFDAAPDNSMLNLRFVQKGDDTFHVLLQPLLPASSGSPLGNPGAAKGLAPGHRPVGWGGAAEQVEFRWL